MKRTNRHDFPPLVKELLAKRAGYLCSNPTCRKPTIGSHTQPEKKALAGVASHISAASPGGPRYSSELSPIQRKDASNGIWLCCNCTKIIDSDTLKFTKDNLNKWKIEAELESRNRLIGTSINQKCPYIEVDLEGHGRSRVNMRISIKNPIEELNGRKVIVAGNKPIIHWGLTWRFDLVIHNNSSTPAINVKLFSVGSLGFTSAEKLKDINQIPPFGNLKLKVEYREEVEYDHTGADDILRPRFPDKFKDLILKLTYLDESRNEHLTLVEFVDGKIVNSKG